MTTKQASEKYGRTRQTIQDWIKAGKLRAFRKGRNWCVVEGQPPPHQTGLTKDELLWIEVLGQEES